MRRRLLFTGDASVSLDHVAHALSTRGPSAWHVQIVQPLAATPTSMRGEWPDVAVVHAVGTKLGDLRSVFRWLKVSARLPVLVVTAPDELEHRLLAIAYHVDDDAVAPISDAELIARVERLADRRAAMSRGPLGDLVLDERTHEVCRRGQRIRLTPTEFQVLERLVGAPNEPVSIDELAKAADLQNGKRNTVQVHISALRRKLDGTGPALIHTASGRGYYLRPAPEIDVEQRLAMLARREQLVKEREDAVTRRTQLLARSESQTRRPH